MWFLWFQKGCFYRAEGALTIECQRTDYGPWIRECAREAFMGLFERGNGMVVHRFWSPKSQGSWDLYSIDEIRRGYARATRNYRLEMKLREASHTGFSDLTKVCRTGYPEATFWHFFFWKLDFVTLDPADALGTPSVDSNMLAGVFAM